MGARARARHVFDRHQIHCRLLLPCAVATNDESASSQNVAAAIVVEEFDMNDIPGAALSVRLEVVPFQS